MKKILLSSAILVISFTLNAQPSFDENTTDTTSTTSTTDMVPIDGGITALLAAGIGYGVKKVIDLKKNKH